MANSEYTAYFRAQLVGDDEALRRLHTLYREIEKIDNKKLEIRANADGFQRELDRIADRLKQLHNDEYLKFQYKGNADELEAEIKALKQEQTSYSQLKRDAVRDMSEMTHQAQRYQSEIDSINKSVDTMAGLMKDRIANSASMKSWQEDLSAAAHSAEDFATRMAHVKSVIAELESERSKLQYNELSPKEYGEKYEELTQKIAYAKSVQSELTAEQRQSEEAAARAAASMKEEADAAQQAASATQEVATAGTEASATMEAVAESSDKAADSMGDVAEKAEEAKTSVITLSEVLQGFGSFMQTVGDAMQSFSGFLGGNIGGAFSSMSSMFDTDFMHYAEMWASKAITSTFMDNFAEGAARYDILSTYNSYLAALGIGDEAANASLERLNAGIQGLPLGLSDVAFQARRYAMYMGNDIDKATAFTLGMNQALIAGGANEQMRRTTTYELERLMSVGKLNTARQWNALLQGFGVSVNFLKEELGAADMTIQEFAYALSEGEIETQDFMNAVAALNGNEGLAGLIDIYKGTIESAMSNIHFALIRGKANIIDAFSETLDAVTGFNLAETINKVRDNLNEIFLGISDYIRSNPELIEGALERIMGIFDRAKQFDWAGTADKIFTNIGRMLDIFMSIWDQLPEGAVSDFVAFATTWAGPLGSAFQALSSGLPFVFALFERMKDFNWEMLAQDVFENVGKLIGKLVEIMNMIPDDLLSKIISWGLVFAGPMGKVVSGIGKVLSAMASWKIFTGGGLFAFGSGKAAAVVNMANSLKAIGLAFVSFAAFAGEMAIAGLVIKEFSTIAADIGAMDFGNFTSNLEQLVPAIGVTATIVTTLSMLFATLHQASGGTFSLAVLAGEGLTAGLVALVGEVGLVIKEMAEAANAVSQAEIPSTGKLKSFANVVNDIMTALIDIDLSDSSKITSRKLDYDNLSSIIDDMVAIGNDLKDLKDLKLTDPEIRTAGSHAVEIVNALGSIVGGIEKAFAGKTEDLTRYDASKTGSAANIITNMKTTMDALSGVATTIKDMMPTLKGLTQDFTNGQAKTLMQHFAEDVPIIIETIGSVYTQIVDLFDNTDEKGRAEFGAGDAYGGLGWSEKASNKISTILLNINTALTDLHTIMGTMSDMTSSATQLMNDYTGEGSRMKIFKDRLLGDGGFIQSIGEIFTTMKNAFGGEEGSTFDLTHADVGSSAINNIFENIRKAFTSLKVIMEKIPKMLEDLDKLTFSDGYGGTALGNFQYKFEILVDSIASMFQYIHDSPIFAQTDSLDVFTEANNRLEQLAGENGAMARIASIVSYLYDMQSEVSGLIDASKGEEGFTLGTQLGSIFAGLKSAFDEISQGTSNVYAMPVMADSLFQAIENIETVILRLRGMSGSVGALANGEDGDVLGALPTIFAGLKSAFDELGGDSSTIQATADAANNLASALDEVETSAGNAKTGIDNLKTSVSELANMMMVKEGGLSSFGGRLNYVGAMANAAAGQVRSLRDAISSLPTEKTVRVNYVQNGGSVSALKSSVGSLLGRLGHKANGGIIPAYFANGGLGFVPYGTDTVPAMLTPGEYVHRRAAVKAFGEQFMSRINNLDLTGALQALSLRAGSGIIPRQIPTVNNTYNRDNHAKLTQNIYSNNPNYSMKRASRWMRSL